MKYHTIKSDIWEDEKLSKLDFVGRLFFIGLISQANDYGKLRGNIQLLKSKIFPYDDGEVKIEDYIKELVSFGMIESYNVNDEQYLKINNWSKYQKVEHPSKDIIPEPSREFHEGFAKSSEAFAPNQVNQVNILK